jgi:hypothetical protein
MLVPFESRTMDMLVDDGSWLVDDRLLNNGSCWFVDNILVGMVAMVVMDIRVDVVYNWSVMVDNLLMSVSTALTND